jgi:uncharacterized membrane protein YedE/YeeE
MKRVIAALLCGAMFGIGLAMSRMTDPTVVLGFLDLFGRFDPTLAFVLAGAVGTTALAFHFVMRRSQPLFAPDFQLPASKVIDRPLLMGAAIFGVGWGMAGYCPGPVLVAAASGIHTALVFVPCMILGSLAHRLFAKGG